MPKVSEIYIGRQMERSVSSTGIFRLKISLHFDKLVYFPSSLHLCKELKKGMKNAKSHSSWLVRFNRKMSFYFPWVSPLLSNRSLWHNRKHPWCVRSIGFLLRVSFLFGQTSRTNILFLGILYNVENE